jgi:hypothetical protein
MPSIQDDISRLVAIAKSSAGGKDLASISGAKLATDPPKQARPAPPSADTAALAAPRPVRVRPVRPVKAEAAMHVQTLLGAVASTVLVAAALTGSSLFLLPTYEIWRYQDAGEGSRMGTLVLEKPAEIWPFGQDDGLLPGTDSDSNAPA